MYFSLQIVRRRYVQVVGGNNPIVLNEMRIPSDADQRSEMMSTTIRRYADYSSAILRMLTVSSKKSIESVPIVPFQTTILNRFGDVLS